MKLKFIFSLTMIGLVVLFVVQNVEVVEIQYFIWTLSISRAILLFCVLAVGILVGWFLHSYLDYHEKSRGSRATE